jgi:hypothetical protein
LFGQCPRLVLALTISHRPPPPLHPLPCVKPSNPQHQPPFPPTPPFRRSPTLPPQHIPPPHPSSDRLPHPSYFTHPLSPLIDPSEESMSGAPISPSLSSGPPPQPASNPRSPSPPPRVTPLAESSAVEDSQASLADSSQWAPLRPQERAIVRKSSHKLRLQALSARRRSVPSSQDSEDRPPSARNMPSLQAIPSQQVIVQFT